MTAPTSIAHGRLFAVVLLASACGGSTGTVEESPSSESYGGESVGSTDAQMEDADLGEEAGVASPPPSMGVRATTPTVARTGLDQNLYADLLSAEGDLHGLASVDCESAQDLRRRICSLSERICEIADANPDDQPTAERCHDGAARCERATDRFATMCSHHPL